MKIVFRVLLVLTLLAVGVWLWMFFFPSPEKAIRKRLLEVSKEATFTASNNDVANGFAVNRLMGYLTTDATVALDIPPPVGRIEFEGRDEIRLAAMGARKAFTVKVEFVDIAPVLGPDKKTAEVELTAKLSVSGEREFVPQELSIQMKEVEGKWLIARVETVNVFR